MKRKPLLTIIKSIFLFLGCSMFFFAAEAQQNGTKTYYKTKYGAAIQDSTKAKFVVINTSDSDGTTHYEKRKIKGDQLVESRSYKGQEPVGKWLDHNGEELDYNFQMVYQPKQYQDVDSLPASMPNDSKDADFEPAQFGSDGIDIHGFLAATVKYPVFSRENNIQGKVLVQFLINTKGQPYNFSIFKSVHPDLDKEVIRALRKMGIWKPAKYKGNPVLSSVIIPASFKLQE